MLQYDGNKGQLSISIMVHLVTENEILLAVSPVCRWGSSFWRMCTHRAQGCAAWAATAGTAAGAWRRLAPARAPPARSLRRAPWPGRRAAPVQAPAARPPQPPRLQKSSRPGPCAQPGHTLQHSSLHGAEDPSRRPKQGQSIYGIQSYTCICRDLQPRLFPSDMICCNQLVYCYLVGYSMACSLMPRARRLPSGGRLLHLCRASLRGRATPIGRLSSSCCVHPCETHDWLGTYLSPSC